jgi:hypothetical protein
MKAHSRHSEGFIKGKIVSYDVGDLSPRASGCPAGAGAEGFASYVGAQLPGMDDVIIWAAEDTADRHTVMAALVRSVYLTSRVQEHPDRLEIQGCTSDDVADLTTLLATEAPGVSWSTRNA